MSTSNCTEVDVTINGKVSINMYSKKGFADWGLAWDALAGSSQTGENMMIQKRFSKLFTVTFNTCKWCEKIAGASICEALP